MNHAGKNAGKKHTKVGVLGGGQLASMLIAAAEKLNRKLDNHVITISLLCEDDSEATSGYPLRLVAGMHETAAIEAWVKACDVITFEHEHVDLIALNKIPGVSQKMRPNGNSVRIAQDRSLEKKLFEELRIPVAPYLSLGGNVPIADLDAGKLLPGIVKTATQGYDGKGQIAVNNLEELHAACAKLAPHRLVLEKRISFQCEVSQVSVRSCAGEIKHYPLVENQHRSGILLSTTAPAVLGAELAELQIIAQEYAERLANHLDYVGVFAIEFFLANGELIANEWAPRVHNSGHWTIEGANSSQFENHLLAVAGLELDLCELMVPAVMMWNLIGVTKERVTEILELAKLSHSKTVFNFHWYGKSPRRGRKVGHITICEPPNSAANVSLNLALLPLIKT